MNVLSPIRREAKDIKKAYKDGYTDGVKAGVKYVIMVTCLYLSDHRGWIPRSIAKAVSWISQTAMSCGEGYTTFPEIEEAVRDQCGIYTNKEDQFFFDEKLVKS